MYRKQKHILTCINILFACTAVTLGNETNNTMRIGIHTVFGRGDTALDQHYEQHLFDDEAYSYVQVWHWWQTEFYPGRSLAELEQSVDEALSHGHKVELVIGLTPSWSSPDFTKFPHYMWDFYSYCARVATTLRGKISSYVLWHEANITVHWSDSPSELVDLLWPAYNAINNADPQARVVMPGASDGQVETIFGTTNDASEIRRYYDYLIDNVADYCHAFSMGFSDEGLIEDIHYPLDGQGAINSVVDHYHMFKSKLAVAGYPDKEITVDESWAAWLDYGYSGGYSVLNETTQATNTNVMIGSLLDAGMNKFQIDAYEFNTGIYNLGLMKTIDAEHQLPSHKVITGYDGIRISKGFYGANNNWVDCSAYYNVPEDPYRPAFYIFKWWSQIAPRSADCRRTDIFYANGFSGTTYKAASHNRTDNEFILHIYAANGAVNPDIAVYAIDKDGIGWPNGYPVRIDYRTEDIDFTTGQSSNISTGTLYGNVVSGALHVTMTGNLRTFTRFNFKLNNAPLDAEITNVNIPVLYTGVTSTASITVKNTGTTTWNSTDFQLLNLQNCFVEPQEHPLGPGESIAPGHSKVFTFNVTPAVIGGMCNVDWRMIRQGVAFFGETRKSRLHVKESYAAYNLTAARMDSAIYLTWRPPVNPPVSVEGYNIYYRTDGPLVKVNNAPTQETAYLATGLDNNTVYNFRIRCVSNGIEWGNDSQEVVARPGDIYGERNYFVNHTIPLTMAADETRAVSVVVENGGPTTWTGDETLIGFLWDDEITPHPLGDGSAGVTPGQSHQFQFEITAPSLPGIYGLRFVVIRQNVGWFPYEMKATVYVD